MYSVRRQMIFTHTGHLIHQIHFPDRSLDNGFSSAFEEDGSGVEDGLVRFRLERDFG